MSALMPNSSGVYPSSVRGFNASIANQSAPRPDAFGSFGTDPITGASYTDKASAQAALGQYANPNSNASRYLASMQPAMLPGRSGGGGGGGGGRMGPQNQRKIMNVGPSTSAEYTAKHGGLSPQRPSTLDAAYRRGDFGLGQQQQQQQIDDAKEDAEFNAAPRQDLTAFDKPQDPTQLVTPPGGGSIPPEPGQTWNDETGWENRAKGGPMHPGQKPYLVGEDGPELIMPRQDGSGFVLPADVTAQILPAMRPTPRRNGGPMSYTPRAEGGVMYLDDGGMVARGFDYGPGMRGHSTSVPSAATANAAGPRPDTIMLDPSGRYQVDPTQPGMPMMPDNVTGPWAQPGLPAPDMTAQNAMITRRVEAMPGRGAMEASRYPGQTFDDTSLKSVLEYGNAMPGDTVEELNARTRQYQQGLRDPYAGSSGSGLTFEEMQQRVALRGMMYGDDYRDTQARNQTQADLASRAARVPIGTPTAPTNQMMGMPMMSPSTLARVERNQERFLRSPEGAKFAMQSGQKLQERMAMIQPVPIGDQGDYVIPLTGQYVSANGRQRQMTPEEASQFGLAPESIVDGQVRYGRSKAAPKQQFIDTFTGNTVQFDADIDTSSLDPKRYTPLRRTTTAPAAGSAAPVAATTKADYDRLPSGTRYTAPDGKVYTKK